MTFDNRDVNPDDLMKAFTKDLPEPTNGENCSGCDEVRAGKMAPSHNGSRYCESGSIASGGDRSHCTCDWCF